MSIWPDPTHLARAGEKGRLEEAELQVVDPAALQGDLPGDISPPPGQAKTGDRRERLLPRLADPDAPLLVVEGLTTHFRLGGQTVHAVDDVSFSLEDGEALGIAGESGCGKTTTALSLLRLLPSNAEVVGAPYGCSGSTSSRSRTRLCSAIAGARSRSSSRGP